MEDITNKVGTSGGFERREFIKRAATVAWAAPVIFTLMSRPAAAQVVVCATSGHTGGLGAACDAPEQTACPTGFVCLGGPEQVDGCGCSPL